MTLPLCMIRTLHMRLREKFGLAFIFAIVLVEVIFTILRVVFSVTTAYSKVPMHNTLWASLDPIIAVMVCTLPCYRSCLSFDRARSIIRTPNISLTSSGLMNLMGVSSPGEKEPLSLESRLNEVSTTELPNNDQVG